MSKPHPNPEEDAGFRHPHQRGTYHVGNLAFELSYDGPRDDPRNIDLIDAYVCGTFPLTVSIAKAVKLLVQDEVIDLADVIRTGRFEEI